MTLAGTQKYERLNKNIGILSRIGLLNQFVSFTADMARTLVNQTVAGFKMFMADEEWLEKHTESREEGLTKKSQGSKDFCPLSIALNYTWCNCSNSCT